jgi:hypothetical protein
LPSRPTTAGTMTKGISRGPAGTPSLTTAVVSGLFWRRAGPASRTPRGPPARSRRLTGQRGGWEDPGHPRNTRRLSDALKGRMLIALMLPQGLGVRLRQLQRASGPRLPLLPLGDDGGGSWQGFVERAQRHHRRRHLADHLLLQHLSSPLFDYPGRPGPVWRYLHLAPSCSATCSACSTPA